MRSPRVRSTVRVEELEQMAFRFSESREGVINALEEYERSCAEEGARARAAAERIAALTMLEILHEP
ncbi:MAG: hypothetical protein KGH72_03555 [Candidatus Micrarchaeota archaeon]|nr:hypothetical protein [Candidatus Micrarchaeota archaeon]